MPLLAHFGVGEEPVEDAEPFGEGVVVGRDRARKEEQRRIAVGLCEIAEHLVVRAVLFDDVDDVLDRRVVGARTTSDIPSGSRGPRAPRRAPRVPGRRRCWRDRDGAVQLAERVARDLEVGDWNVRLRAARIRCAATALAVHDPQRVGAERQERRGIPSPLESGQ